MDVGEREGAGGTPIGMYCNWKEYIKKTSTQAVLVKTILRKMLASHGGE